MPTSTTPTHYEVLGLQPQTPGSSISDEEIKRAYHRALLDHHPDKQRTPPTPPTTQSAPPPRPANAPVQSKYAIDLILEAHRIISNPHLRADYDRSLLSLSSHLRVRTSDHLSARDAAAQSGIETVELRRMAFEAGGGVCLAL